jgi:hypothetical protein
LRERGVAGVRTRFRAGRTGLRIASFVLGPLITVSVSGGIAGIAAITPATAQPAESPSFTERMKNLFLGTPSTPKQQANAPRDEPECPVVDVRSGASTLTVHGPGETVATNVRYQATIAQTARECAVLGATMTIKVGLQGRIILGPLGGPGKLDVPVRMALVHEGPQPKTLWTKLYQIPVAIPAGQTNVPFVHVEQDLTVPVPKDADLESYIVYVGFDQMGAKEPKPRTKPKSPPRDR